uniref:p12 n=1 Tax=Campoletis sonorensis ichnovirus TaxID=10484 RepID=Q9YZ27_CSIV|nr:p12 [Ichnoviriform sonorense]
MSYYSLGTSVLSSGLSVLTAYHVYMLEKVNVENNPSDDDKGQYKQQLKVARYGSLASAASSTVNGALHAYSAVRSRQNDNDPMLLDSDAGIN